MNVEFINFVAFIFFKTLSLLSILGFGNFINKNIIIFKINLELKNLIFIYGLIFLGFIFIIINFFFPISNFYSILTIIFGSTLYSYYFFKKDNRKNEFFFILITLIFSSFYSFYAGLSDDFNYHYETIKNFKNQNLFEILHHRTISYNSHWLFLSSIFNISYFTSTLFILTSLFFSIFIYDLFNLSYGILKNRSNYLSIISFLFLIFFLGVLNNYKDLGTDIPGVIVCFYVLIIIIHFIFDEKLKNLNEIFLLILLLVYFSIIVKVTNALVVLFLFFLLFKISFKKLNFFKILLFSLFPLAWLFQNFIISGCLIWPISITCIYNVDLAINESYLIESFAKGDISTTMEVNSFTWINIWVTNHLNKMLEIYLAYIVILIIPILYLLFKKENIKKILIKFLKEKYFDFNYKLLLLIIIICNVVWFLNAPAYRFGIFYNLLFIVFSILPFWIFLFEKSFNFITTYSKVIFILICIYFIFENINKIDWYNKRYDMWPPILKEELLKRKNF